MTVTVRDICDRAQSLDAYSQKLLDADGKQYSVDSLATADLDEGIGYEQTNPGNALDTTVVFDVPVGTVPAEIELHDSAFSGGRTVALR